MGNYRTVFIICVGVLALLALAGYILFEIYPTPSYSRPSTESLANEYLALDRWLQKTGHSLRTKTTGEKGLLQGLPEKTLLIESSRFDWSRDGAAVSSWVEAGGNLVLFLDFPWYEEDEDQWIFLEGLGIKTEKYASFAEEEEEYAEEDNSGDGENGPPFPAPYFDSLIRLGLDENPGAPGFTLKDHWGIIRLVTVPLGQGSVTVTGVPYFMLSSHIGEEQNARLAWRLTGGLDRENRGIYFIRGREPASSFFGRLAERGNIGALVVSALILALIGLWMVLPVFGRPVRDEERPGKPIGDRFRAESRFLRKYGALDFYLEVYVEDLRKKLRARRGIYRPDQMAPALAGLWGMDISKVEKIIHPQGKLTHRDFVNYVRLIENTEERL
jgi:hypothetical protein